MNRYRILSVIVILSASSAAFAVRVANRVYYFSEGVTDPFWPQSHLQWLRQLAAQGRFAQAATGIFETVQSAAGAANVIAPEPRDRLASSSLLLALITWERLRAGRMGAFPHRLGNLRPTSN